MLKTCNKETNAASGRGAAGGRVVVAVLAREAKTARELKGSAIDIQQRPVMFDPDLRIGGVWK
jgi:hypothetical protein